MHAALSFNLLALLAAADNTNIESNQTYPATYGNANQIAGPHVAGCLPDHLLGSRGVFSAAIEAQGQAPLVPPLRRRRKPACAAHPAPRSGGL